MKYLVSFLLLFCGLSAFSQADTIFVLGAEFGATTEPTDSTFTVDIIHPTDQLGQAFTASKIQVGYRLIDVFGRLYRVKSVDATGIGSSTLTVVELQDAAGPSGTGLVYRKPDNSDCIPEIQTGDIGISYALAARVANHNAVNGCSNVEVTAAILTDSMAVVRDSIAAVRADIGTGGGGTVETITSSDGNLTFDATDPANIVATNNAPDQTVSLTGAGTVGITGTYPDFTVTGTGLSGVGTVDFLPYFSGTTSLSNSVLRQNPSGFLGLNTGATERLTIGPAANNEISMLSSSGNKMYLGIFGDNIAWTINRKISNGVYSDASKCIAELGIETSTSQGRITMRTTNTPGSYPSAPTLTLSGSGRLGLGSNTNASYSIELFGTSAAARFTPHDVTLTGVEGLFYFDLSEHTAKGHNGTSFFRFMQQSTTIPTNGQIPVWNSTTGLYEPTTATPAQTPAPSSTADSIGNTGDIRYDDDYIYIKTGAGWKRSALSTF